MNSIYQGHSKLGPYIAVLVTALLLSVCPEGSSRANALELIENDLKAQYVLNISKFVSWPKPESGNQKEMLFCLLGIDDIFNAFKAFEKTKIDQRKIVVKQFRNQSLVDQCDVLYISDSEKAITKKVVTRLSSKPVLTISGQNNFLTVGGMVELYRQKSKLRFDIKLDAVTSAHLKISSKLLRLTGNHPEQSD